VTGTVCLQGGAEFGADCAAMDADLLLRAGGPVVVTALAGEVGHDYRTASENGVRHFRALGAADVVAAPDAREDREGALAALRRARLLFLPGGSPSRLLDALRATGVDDVVHDLLAAGGVVAGSSAGAMVLGGWTVLPERRPGGVPEVVRGLGVVPDVVVVPHWSGSGRTDWLRAITAAVPDEVVVLGVPEQSGVLMQNGRLASVGAAPASLLPSADVLPLHSATTPPGPA
jgi:cyanophycinase